uniref:Uncharacterized protein n=1 Tax=Octopus bimaculoides TaxID=37653 RepID=A0A0L8GI89_OCTBM
MMSVLPMMLHNRTTNNNNSHVVRRKTTKHFVAINQSWANNNNSNNNCFTATAAQTNLTSIVSQNQPNYYNTTKPKGLPSLLL